MKHTNSSPRLDPAPCVSEEQSGTYATPAIVYESALEVRAGTPLGLPDPLDLTGTQQ